MAGLLSPESGGALARLGAGLLAGNFAGGLASASEYASGLQDQKLKRGLLEAQIAETQGQAQERAAKLEALRRQQEFDRQFFGLGGGAAPSGTSVAGGPPMPSASAPSMPSGGAPAAPGGGFTAQQISAQFGVPIEAVIADYKFNGGKKIAELIESRSKPNWQNINGNLVNTNAPGFQGGFQPGMSVSSNGQVTAWQPNGQGGVVVGAPQGAFDTFRQYQNLQEGTRAAYDPMQVVGPGGANYYVPRSQVVQGAQGGGAQRPSAVGSADADRFAILSQELAKARAAGNAGDVAAIEAEISRLSPAARTGVNPSGLTVPGFQATPTAAQAADAAGAKVKAEAEARAQAERTAGRQGKADKANEMLSNIWRARVLLESDPTGSLVGAGVDKLMGIGGMSTPSSQAADRLETLSGWLVSNVPRMEGPQSNFDVDNYKTMAGRIGDRSYPAAARLAALDEVERIQKKYAHLNQGDGQQTSSTDQKPKQVLNELPKTAKKGTRVRDTTTGEILIFNGLTWAKE